LNPPRESGLVVLTLSFVDPDPEQTCWAFGFVVVVAAADTGVRRLQVRDASVQLLKAWRNW
jgi:hypothetical protein